jgi:hypothetical protein
LNEDAVDAYRATYAKDTRIIRNVDYFGTHPTLAAQAALVKLATEHPDDGCLRQVYSYLVDADPLGDTRITHATHAIRRALTTDDPLLKAGYIDRAKEAMGQFIVPMGENGYVEPAKAIAKRLNQQEAADDDGEDDDD